MPMTPLCIIQLVFIQDLPKRNYRPQGWPLQNAYPLTYIISSWGRRNLVSFNASKTQFLHLSTRCNLPNNYPLFFDNTQLSPSSTISILVHSFTHNLNWKLHISSLTKSASSKFGVLYRLSQFFSPSQLLSIYKGLVRPRMEYASPVWGGFTHTSFLDRVQSKALRLISCSSLTISLLSISAVLLQTFLSFTAIFMQLASSEEQSA